MTEEIKNEMIEAGFDVEDALKRLLNNESLYEKFLKRFPDDPNFSALQDAVSNCEKEKAFDAAHTLKGLCGNLSINNILNLVSKQVEYFRADQWDEGVAMMDDITREYNRTVEILSKL